MPTQQDVPNHYTHGSYGAAIRNGIESLGKTIDSVTVDDLAPVDEFHIGGLRASEDFLSQLDPPDPLKIMKADLQQRIIVERGKP
jgi:hypothetical protein